MAEPSNLSPAVASLARRLRDLRRSKFPDARLTQADVAQALSEEEPVGISTLSSWENVRTPTLPSRSRLSAYARFFATSRSLDPKPHLIPLTDLSPSELERLRELEKELFRLRDTDAGELASKHQSWRFEDSAPIIIICSDLSESDEVMLGPLSDADNPNFTALSSFADLDALIDLWGHLRALNPHTEVDYKRASQATADDLTSHLILLGGIAWNDVTRRLNDSINLPIRQVANEKIHSGEIFEVVGGLNYGHQYLPRWRNDDPGTAEKPGVLLEDVAMVARLPNPFNVLRTLTYCNGIHSRGVLGAVRCLTDATVRDTNERYLEEAFVGSDRFVVLMRVPVVGGRTISPSLNNPEAILFQWPDAPAARIEED